MCNISPFRVHLLNKWPHSHACASTFELCLCTLLNSSFWPFNVLEINEAERDTTRKHQLSSEHSRDRISKKVDVTEYLQLKESNANSHLSKIVHHILLILLYQESLCFDCISDRKFTRTFRFLKTEKSIFIRKSTKDLRTPDYSRTPRD